MFISIHLAAEKLRSTEAIVTGMVDNELTTLQDRTKVVAMLLLWNQTTVEFSKHIILWSVLSHKYT